MSDDAPKTEEMAARLALAQSQDAVENAVRQIAQETGAHPDTLRLALQSLAVERQDKSFLARIRRQWASMDTATKRVVISAFLGIQVGAFQAAIRSWGDNWGLFQIATTVLVVLGVYNLLFAVKRELGALAGAAFGFALIVSMAFFSMVLRSPDGVEGLAVIPFTLLGALVGFVASRNSHRFRKLKLHQDPEKRREELLKQLVELQDQLRQGEQIVTFLSVDVAGSTRIKSTTDPLASEYSFGEYTNFVVSSSQKFGGSLHSTAGDGVLLTFDHPQQAFQAARRIQAGMLEFNTFRNRTGTPFELRCGIHTGVVVAPTKDLRSVAYSHVIDLASHVQRQAPPGGIAVSEDAAVFLQGGAPAVGTESVEVQGLRAVIWRSGLEATGVAAASAPPPPPFAV